MENLCLFFLINVGEVESVFEKFCQKYFLRICTNSCGFMAISGTVSSLIRIFKVTSQISGKCLLPNY